MWYHGIRRCPGPRNRGLDAENGRACHGQKTDRADGIPADPAGCQVLGILTAMILATGAGLWISLTQESAARDRTLTAAVQSMSDALALSAEEDWEQAARLH